MIILQKFHKKMITNFVIPIIKDKEELYKKIDYLEKNTINIYYVLF